MFKNTERAGHSQAMPAARQIAARGAEPLSHVIWNVHNHLHRRTNGVADGPAGQGATLEGST
jgi:hypothetical protein